jgi:hypothetical protein
MITDRVFRPDEDMNLLELSLAKDEHHKGTPAEFFNQYGTVTKVYEDDNGPVLFVRGAKALRLDIQYVDNDDHERNKAAMLAGFDGLVEKAKANGFTEIVFNTNSRALKIFCKREFGFKESDGELRKHI